MRPRRSAFILAAFAAIAALVAAASASAAAPKLVGETGPGFTIQLKSSTGKAVKSLKAGTYVLKVEDKSPIHNFHLTGPGVNKLTAVDGTGTKTWTVKLKPGKYTYKCDIHAAEGMTGTFKVIK